LQLITYLRSHPIRTGLLLMAGYFLFFITPDAFGPNSFGRGHGVETAKDMNAKLVPEIALTISLLVVVAALGWWKSCGFIMKFHKGGLKFVLVPFVFTLGILGVAAIMALGKGETLVTLVGGKSLAVLVAMTLLVGLFEETLFRGVVFMGWEKRYGPILALVVSSLVFGLFHFVNWATGQPFEETLRQVTHAGLVGFMYGALRLRIGSILPVIILHGFWDATITIMGSTTAAMTAHTARTMSELPIADSHPIVTFLFSAIEPGYGLFVLWRWHVWRKNHEAP